MPPQNPRQGQYRQGPPRHGQYRPPPPGQYPPRQGQYPPRQGQYQPPRPTPPPPPQAPRRSPRPAPPPAYRDEPRTRRPRRRRGGMAKRVLGVVVLLVAALVVYADFSLTRTEALSDYPDRVGGTPGTNWLIVGSDSREGLTPEEQAELATGDVEGRRTDTIMLLHVPGLGGGQPTLVSLPRDSSVPLPGSGERVKLNATYAIGGPPLLAQTVETVTGVHLDHYAEIGFGGFAGIVDDIGGVELCLPEPIADPLAGIDLPAGCQELSGPQALGYVRTRASANGDLDRVMRQREFLGALVSRATSPAVLLNPFRSIPLVTGVPDALTVGNGDHIWHLARLGWAMRGISSGGVITTTVPIAGFGEVDDGGSAVLWDSDAAAAMFDALAQDRPVPPEVLPR